MALISKSFTFTSGATIVASEHNTNFDTLYNEINGNLDNNNIKANAAIADSKLAQLTTANKVALTAIQNYPFVQGDWIVSSVTTARTGWTNVSATYSNKFMRINATPLTTGGTDTHLHTVTLVAANIPAHTHSVIVLSGSGSGGRHTVGDVDGNDDSQSDTYNTSSFGAGSAANTSTGDNVPTYVQVVIFQKD